MSKLVYDASNKKIAPKSIQCTTAMFPGVPFIDAIERIEHMVHTRPELSMDWVQLCPQSFGVVNEGLIDELKHRYPNTVFQLHSNVRLECGKNPVHGSSHGAWVEQYLSTFARLTMHSGCGIYSLHTGYEDEMSLPEMFDNIRNWNERFGIIIAIEGLYPERKRKALVSTWAEYEQLLYAQVPYAIDLSHLNIVATAEKDLPLSLVHELLRSPHCREIHLSANNGRIDAHQPWSKNNQEWWWNLIDTKHAECIVFCEENLQRRKYRI